jgi:thiamine biosynthesis protein ThiI
MIETHSTTILLRYGEIGLKTDYVRTSFEHRLIHNITTALTTHGIPHTITNGRGRIYLTTPHPDQTIPILQHISGLVSVSPTTTTTSDLTALTQDTITYATPLLSPTTSFALRVTRTGTHPYTSQDAAIHIGAALQTHTHAPVNLTAPTQEIHIEIRNKNAYLYTQIIRGIGGLPVGTQGTVAVLLTHPTDLLAAWYMMHRGCQLLLITTNTALTALIHQFQTTWNLTSPTHHLDPTTPDYHDALHHLCLYHHCDALATPTTLADPQAIHHLTTLKTHIHLPLLTPLIALTHQEITAQCIHRHIPST